MVASGSRGAPGGLEIGVDDERCGIQGWIFIPCDVHMCWWFFRQRFGHMDGTPKITAEGGVTISTVSDVRRQRESLFQQSCDIKRGGGVTQGEGCLLRTDCSKERE